MSKREYWKVYLVLLHHRLSQARLAKIGVTSKYDILERFALGNDQRWSRFEFTQAPMRINTPSYEVAYAWEQRLHSEFRKNIWAEKYLPVDEDGLGNYDNFGGITELFAYHTGTSYADVEFERVYEGEKRTIILPHIRSVIGRFREVKDFIERDQLVAPTPLETFRINAGMSLTLEEVQNANRR